MTPQPTPRPAGGAAVDLERMREIAAKSNDIDDLSGSLFDLCTHAETLAAEVDRLRIALALYADPDSYRVWVDQPPGGRILIHGWALSDCGLAAREALAADPQEAARHADN